MRTPRRILVVRTDRLGDVVLATPLVRALRVTFPDAFIGVLVQPYTRDVLMHNPRIDEILVDDAHGEHKGRRGFWQQVSMLRTRKFDTALLLLPTERAAWMLFFAGIPRRIGVGTKLYGVLTFMQGVSRHKYIPLRHEADYCMDLGRRIGVRSDDLRPEVFITDEERLAAKKLLSNAGVEENDTIIGLHADSGNSSPSWEIARYGELAEYIARRTPETVKLVFTDNATAAPLPRSRRIVNLRGKLPLRELMGVLSWLRLLVSSNTGPMHIAAGLQVPTISLFCPLPACSATLWGPKGNDARILLPPDGFCQSRCAGDPKKCRLEELTVEQAATAVLESITNVTA